MTTVRADLTIEVVIGVDDDVDVDELMEELGEEVTDLVDRECHLDDVGFQGFKIRSVES